MMMMKKVLVSMTQFVCDGRILLFVTSFGED